MITGRSHHERGIGALGVLALLAAVAILAVLAVCLLPRTSGGGTGHRAGTPEPGVATPPAQRAESVECRNNLNQMRQAITMYQSANESLPPDLQTLSSQGVAPSMLACPVGGSDYAYQYDPQTGRVGCRYPGHERY